MTGVASLASVADLPSYISLNKANSVNDSDRIVGWGLDSNSRYRGFILRPNE